MMPPPMKRRKTPSAATIRQKFRPTLLDERLPITAPNSAMGTISQFAQPRKGRTVGIIRSRAMKPMIEARMLNIQHRRSEEHTSELQSLMRISYAVFCLKKKKNTKYNTSEHTQTYHRPNKHIIIKK